MDFKGLSSCQWCNSCLIFVAKFFELKVQLIPAPCYRTWGKTEPPVRDDSKRVATVAQICSGGAGWFWRFVRPKAHAVSI